MKQGDEILSSLGTGAAKISENSRDPNQRIPSLTLMMPACDYVRNEGYADAIPMHDPARSFELNGNHTRQLYEFLRRYYGDEDKKSST